MVQAIAMFVFKTPIDSIGFCAFSKVVDLEATRGMHVKIFVESLGLGGRAK